MSSIQDPNDIQPRGGDGPNRSLDPSEGESMASASAEDGEAVGGVRDDEGEAPESSLRGINPVQHSE